ncbi:hypothetical protein BDV97DRAFT_373283 [Delphinella strobiligena]|nr:hypothetical protein BDV97DRAFT_373283 [Delphinella strobiligena]
MIMPASPFKIRPATVAASDHALLIDFKDSQLEWLSRIGSSGQWGSTPSREANPSVTEGAFAWVQRSEKQAPWGETWCRAFVAEISGTPVAALVLEAKAPAYVSSMLPGINEKDPFVYLAYLISNGHAGVERKGAGAALIARAKEVAGALGVERLCLDCWGGNGGKLVGYYESQGFRPIGEFSAPVEGTDDWIGCILEMWL